MIKIKPRTIILITGIILFLLSWFMEINFHYLQGFSSHNTPEDIFWRAERAIYPISTTLMIMGIFLIILYFILRNKEFLTIGKLFSIILDILLIIFGITGIIYFVNIDPMNVNMIMIQSGVLIIGIIALMANLLRKEN